jgi:putative ABC transport system permease protein
MWFITIVVKNSIRRPLRSVLTIVAIATAIGAVVALVGVASGFERTFRDLYKGAGIDLIVVRTGARQGLSSTLDQSMGGKIAKIPGVKEVILALADVVSFEDVGLYGVLVQGWVPETRIYDHVRVLEGRSLKKGDTKVVMLGAILAKNLGKSVGDEVKLFEAEQFKVVGIYKSTTVFEDGACIIALDELQRLMDRPNQVTGFSVVLERPIQPGTVDRVRREIEALNPGITASTTEEHVKSVSEIQLAKAMAWLTSSVALFIGAFGVMNTMIMSVHERTREIGVLRAIGWRKRQVVKLILLESVLLSLIGAVVGSLGAMILVRLLTRLPTVSGLIDGRIEPLFVGYGLLIAVVVGLLGGLLPAFRASRMLPSSALRYE